MEDIKNLIKKRVSNEKPERGIHGPMHALAKEISEYCGEPKEFAMYLGVIKNIGLTKAYRIFSEMKQSPNVTTRGKLFLYKSKYKPEINKKKKRSKR